MKTATAAEILERHNQWRRGMFDEMEDPNVLGEAIDKAVETLKNQPSEGLSRETGVKMLEALKFGSYMIKKHWVISGEELTDALHNFEKAISSAEREIEKGGEG